MTPSTVKYLALVAMILAMAYAGLGDRYCSRCTYRFKCERSMHKRMILLFFFHVTTIGAHHCVGSVIGTMISCCCNNSSSALSLSRYANGIERGVLMQNGLASWVRDM